MDKWVAARILDVDVDASLEEIREADYTLVPGRYVGIDDSNKMSEEEIDAEIKKLSQELLELFEENKQLEEKVKEILKQNL
jgi:type I restriction enzyme M protein